ncbi:hypothetical protein [Corallococcus sp. Z5C101001]|uniref:hypothetical protein n=1 Tax=Corallococcus sp. Z5C101001 TaxID=2596829 RepID=UPI001180A660|nr:hypothetical protein [Corallococcus sp. Z5C101001]TSC23893.1 hypothetical protein FOF48_27165 [Corallococcus sp. Z5C101001]
MGYPETLEVLARLHVDPRFRAAWTEDAARALAPLPLMPAEAAALCRVDGPVVERAGRMMDYHRAERVREQLPWVDEAKRPELGPLRQRFLQDVLPEVLNREEAIVWCRFLEADARAPHAPLLQGLPAYVPQLARCERLRIALAWGLLPLPPVGPHVEAFDFPVLSLLAALEAPGWPPAEARPTRVEYLKVPGLPAVMVRELPSP